MPDLILALDQGTSSSRAILFDHAGGIVAVSQQEFPVHYPRPGWVEQDPEDIWSSQLATAQEVMRDAGAAPADVAAIGITNQRETTIVWDREGKPIANAIVWQDRRTADSCASFKDSGLEDEFRSRTGLVLDPYFSGTKIRWLLDNVPGARAKAQDLFFGTIDTWLLYRLCGLHVTDYTNASRTLLYDIFGREWDDSLAARLDVPGNLLPRVCASSGLVAETTALGGSIPVAGIAGDQQAALFGQACFSPGMVKNTLGTGSFVLMNTGVSAARSSTLLTTIAWGLGGDTGDSVTYALEGSIFMAGAAVQWLRDELGLFASSSESEALAASVPNSNGVYVVPAFTGLGAPYWDPAARGAILGLTRGANRAHITRATLEALAFQARDVAEAMEQDSGVAMTEIRVDGGAAANDLLLQMQADILGRDVVRPACLETTALGAAYLAGLGVGFWKDTAEIAANWREERRFSPLMPAGERDELYAGWKRAVERAMHWQE
jgi:glycerol kinase